MAEENTDYDLTAGPDTQNQGQAGQTQTENWIDKFDTLKSDESARTALGKYKTVDDALRGAVEAQKVIGNSIRIPAKDADEKAKAEFDNKIRQIKGIPDKPEGYELLRPSQMPEGMGYDDDMEKQAKVIAHKYGIQKEALQDLSNLLYDRSKTGLENYKKAIEAAEQAQIEQRKKDTAEADSKLRTEIPDYDKSIAMVKQVLKDNGTEDLWLELEKSGMGNNSNLVKFLSKISPRLVEGGFVDVAGSGGMNLKDPLDYKDMPGK